MEGVAKVIQIPINLKETIENQILREIERFIQEEINKVIYRAEDEIADRIRERTAALAVRLVKNISLEFGQDKLIIEVDTSKLDFKE